MPNDDAWELEITALSEGSIVVDFLVKIFNGDRDNGNEVADTLQSSLASLDPGVWLSSDNSVSLSVASITAYGKSQ